MNQSSNIVNIDRGKQQMPSKNGYVSLWRDMKKQDWYHRPDCLAMFTHLMLSVTKSKIKYSHKGVDLMLVEGEFATTYEDLGSVFNMDKSKTRRILDLFKRYGQIYTKEIKQGRINKGIVVGLTGFSKWQLTDNLADTQADTQADTCEVLNLKGYIGYSDTPPDTQADTVLNNNYINNNKDTCQKTKVFPRVPNDEIVSLFSEILPSLPQPKKLTAARKSTLKARHVNDLKSDLNNWRKYFEYVRDNCSWMVSGNFNITFDYLIKQSNLINILEGAKNDRA